MNKGVQISTSDSYPSPERATRTRSQENQLINKATNDLSKLHDEKDSFPSDNSIVHET